MTLYGISSPQLHVFLVFMYTCFQIQLQYTVVEFKQACVHIARTCWNTFLSVEFCKVESNISYFVSVKLEYFVSFRRLALGAHHTWQLRNWKSRSSPKMNSNMCQFTLQRSIQMPLKANKICWTHLSLYSEKEVFCYPSVNAVFCTDLIILSSNVARLREYGRFDVWPAANFDNY